MEVTDSAGKVIAWECFIIGSAAGEGYIEAGHTKHIEINPQVPANVGLKEIGNRDFVSLTEVIEFTGKKRTFSFTLPASDVQRIFWAIGH